MEQVVSLREKTYEYRVSKLLVMVVSIPLFTNAVGSALAYVGLSTQISTLIVYLLVFIYGFFKVIPLSRRKLGQLFSALCVTGITMALNYYFVPESRIYFKANSMELTLMVLIFIPTAVYVVGLKSFELFFEGMRKIALITPILALISYYFFHIYNLINYMVFSMMVLPGCLAAYYFFSKNKGNRIIYLISYLVNLYMLIIYGGRAAFLAAVVYVLLLEVEKYLEQDNTKKVIIFSLLSALLILAVVFGDQLQTALLSILKPFGASSRVVETIIKGRFFESNEVGGRSTIYAFANECLSNMNLSIGGLFGDRIALSRYMSVGVYKTNYVHNFYYEVLLSYGWVVGTTIAAWVTLKSVFAFFLPENTNHREFVIYMLCLEFVRLLVSGSYLIEGPFCIFVASLIMTKIRKHRIER